MVGKTISHYKITKKLGEGGMGEVYLAEDTKLKRQVAIKFLPSRITVNETDKARFLQEAQATATLNHPNIATVYSIEEIDDPHGGKESFIVMEYIEGQELQKIIESHRDAPMLTEDILNYTTQIAKGLKAAHDKGIVHRDIKSSNIIVNEIGQVRIMDFGLAKFSGQTQLTKTGTMLGTIAYMSPEQAKGQTVDKRTDIWSFGVILYEMITGQLPFQSEYEQATVYSIINENPQPVTKIRSDVPQRLEQVVNKSLAKNPDERYHNIEDLLLELKSIQGTLGSGIFDQQESRVISPLKYRIAVLPFTNISPDPEDEYFADGMTEELISALSKINGLRVIARTSVMQYKVIAKSITEIGQELRVGNVLESSIRKSANMLRITVQLVDAQSQEHLWSQDYNRECKDIFFIQSDIAHRVAEALRMKLIGKEKQQIEKQSTENLEAYSWYLKGRYYWNRRTEQGLKKSIECFNRAIVQDPLYALAYAGLADAFIILGDYNYLLQEEAYQKAKNAAERALEIDDNLAQAHTSLGCMASIYSWDWEKAEHEFKQAIKLNPQYATAYHWYAINYLIPNGRFNEAIVNIKRAQDLDPLSLIINTTVGLVYYFARHYEQAIEQYQKTLEMDPNFGATYFFMSWTYEQQALFKEAVNALKRAIKLSGESTAMLTELGCTYAGAGKKDKAIKVLDKLIKTSERHKISPYTMYSIAGIYAGLDDKDQAIKWLQNAHIRRSYQLIYLQVDPKFDNIRSDKRFKTLLKKVGLKQ